MVHTQTALVYSSHGSILEMISFFIALILDGITHLDCGHSSLFSSKNIPHMWSATLRRKRKKYVIRCPANKNKALHLFSVLEWKHWEEKNSKWICLGASSTDSNGKNSLLFTCRLHVEWLTDCCEYATGRTFSLNVYMAWGTYDVVQLRLGQRQRIWLFSFWMSVKYK